MQDSHENPTPTPPEASAGGDTPPVEPTIETTPEPATEPAAAPDLSTTPASTPVEATETAPTVDAPASDPTPITDTTPASDPTPITDTTPASDPTPATDTAPASNPFLSSTDPTPAAAPVTPSASTPITPAPGEKKSSKGIILGVVIGVIVLAIIGICVFLFLNNDNKKSDNNVSNNGSSQEEKSEKKEEKEKEEPKTSAKSIEVGYAGKSFAVTDSYADTIKNAAKSFDIYYEDDNIDPVKIEDIDEYLKGVTPSTTSVHVYITNEEGDDVIEIIGIADYNDYGKESVAYSDLTIREVWLAAYESESYTLGNVSLTLNKTTVDDIKKAFGEKFEYGEETNSYSYKNWNRFDVDLFMNDDDTLNFVTFEPTFE